jgi:hypothetical protein
VKNGGFLPLLVDLKPVWNRAFNRSFPLLHSLIDQNYSFSGRFAIFSTLAKKMPGISCLRVLVPQASYLRLIALPLSSTRFFLLPRSYPAGSSKQPMLTFWTVGYCSAQ